MMRSLFAVLVLALFLIVTGLPTRSAHAAAIKSLPGCAANTLTANDDGSTSAVALPFTMDFFGTSYNSLYVNNNGNVTFSGSLSTFTPFGLLSTSTVIIAPFFGDVDTTSPGSSEVTYGPTTFGGRTAFCVNWVNVNYFGATTADKLNSFQLLLVDRSDIGVGDFDIYFNYDKIQWETGSASNGTNGLGGDSARVGYSNGTDTAFELPGSGANGAFLNSSAGGLIHNSRDSLENGRYIFRVRGGAAPTGGFVSGRVIGRTPDGPQVPLAGATVQICKQDVVPPVCSTTTSDANGDYSVAGLVPGTYNGMAVPPATRADLFPDINELFDLGGGQGLPGYDFKLTLPRPRPPGVTIDSIANTSNGSPVLSWSAPVQVTTMNDTCAGGSATWELIQAGEVIASGSMPQTSTPGLFKGTIPPLRPEHGPALLRIEVACPGAGVDKTLDVDVYIDPSGHVRDVNGTGIVGATVTLLRSDSSSGPFVAVADGSAIMSPSNRTNPDTTTAEGRFGWDVIAGFYVVRAEATGCVSPDNPAQSFVESEVMTIPPPVTDLDLRLNCGGSGPPPTDTPVPPAGLSGDVNCSGGVNAIDSALILQFIAGLVGSLQCQEDGDVNGSGDINSIDAAIVLQFVAGLVPSLPV